jgi:hypothetical protein
MGELSYRRSRWRIPTSPENPERPSVMVAIAPVRANADVPERVTAWMGEFCQTKPFRNNYLAISGVFHNNHLHAYPTPRNWWLQALLKQRVNKATLETGLVIDRGVQPSQSPGPGPRIPPSMIRARRRNVSPLGARDTGPASFAAGLPNLTTESDAARRATTAHRDRSDRECMTDPTIV